MKIRQLLALTMMVPLLAACSLFSSGSAAPEPDRADGGEVSESSAGGGGGYAGGDGESPGDYADSGGDDALGGVEVFDEAEEAAAPASGEADMGGGPAAEAPVAEEVSAGEGLDVDADAAPEEPAVDEPADEPAPERVEAQSGTLTAGDIDDNLNFAAFLRYLTNTLQGGSGLPSVAVADRVTIQIRDDSGLGLSNARVRVLAEGSSLPLIDTYAGSNGVFHFFPAMDGAGSERSFVVEAGPPNAEQFSASLSFDLDDLDEDRTLTLTVEQSAAARPDNLDLVLVIDTTGSMTDELRYLTTEFEAIVGTVRDEFPDVDMRFGLVVYRDVGDTYITRSFDFTDSVSEMQRQLAEQRSEGGGDYPEAMDAAMSDALDLQWRGGNTARLMFLVADAPPHQGDEMDNMVEYTLLARQQGIHIYPLAASGVADEAEFMMRISASLTHGRYLFLTDDSGVGNAHAEPKIACYQVTRLDQLIVRVVTGELAGERIEAGADQIIREVGSQRNGVCLDD